MVFCLQTEDVSKMHVELSTAQLLLVIFEHSCKLSILKDEHGSRGCHRMVVAKDRNAGPGKLFPWAAAHDHPNFRPQRFQWGRAEKSPATIAQDEETAAIFNPTATTVLAKAGTTHRICENIDEVLGVLQVPDEKPKAERIPLAFGRSAPPTPTKAGNAWALGVAKYTQHAEGKINQQEDILGPCASLFLCFF